MMSQIALMLAMIQPLWPEGKIPDFGRAAHRMPYLDWSERPANPNGACVILVSGGSITINGGLSKIDTDRK